MTAEKAISGILKGGLLLTPFLVFVVTRSLYFPFISGKNFAFRIGIEILASLWICAALRFPSFRPRSSAILWAVVAFTAVMGIATIFALSPYKSFWSGFERMEGYVALLHFFLYFVLLISVFRTKRDWQLFFGVSLGVSVLVSLYAIFQLAGTFDIHQGGTRVDATFGNATYLAAYLVFHLFFTAWFFFRSPQRLAKGWWYALIAAEGAIFLAILSALVYYVVSTLGAGSLPLFAKNIILWLFVHVGLKASAVILFLPIGAAWFFIRRRFSSIRITYAIILLLELFILYHTATRGAMLGLLGGSVVLLAMLAFTERGSVRRWSLAGLGVLVLLPISFFLLKDSQFVKQSDVLTRFASISPSETTTQARFTIWKMAIRGWQEHPILGWGQESFIYVFSKYYEPSLWRQEPWFDRAHNIFLDWLVAGGILGLLAYLAMYGGAFWLLVRLWQKEKIGGIEFSIFTSLLAAHIFQNLFVFDNLTSYLLFFAVIAYIHHAAVSHQNETGATRSLRVPLGAAVSVAVITAIVLIFVVYQGNMKPVRAARNILTTLRIVQTEPPAGKIDKVIKTLEDGAALHTFGTSELREQASQIANFVARDAGIVDQEKAKYVRFATSELESQHKEFPTDIRAMAFLTTLYSMVGRTSDAISVINKALAISDRRLQFYFIAAEVYLNAGDATNGLAALRKAHELAPDYPEAVQNLEIALIITGNDKEAEDIHFQRSGSRLFNEERYAQAYLRAGNFAKAAGIWRLLVQGEPSNARLHAALGVALARSGQPNEAIRELQKAIQLEPGFQNDGQKIIDDIRAGRLK